MPTKAVPTKKMVQMFEKLRSSGKHNMLTSDAYEWMHEKTGCSKDEYMSIIKNYEELMKKHGIERRD